jgi:hypothetical protein
MQVTKVDGSLQVNNNNNNNNNNIQGESCSQVLTILASIPCNCSIKHYVASV